MRTTGHWKPWLSHESQLGDPRGALREHADLHTLFAARRGHVSEEHSWRSDKALLREEGQMGARGLVVVERDCWPRHRLDARLRAAGLTTEEALRRYRGFDGRMWPEHALLEQVPRSGGLAFGSYWASLGPVHGQNTAHGSPPGGACGRPPGDRTSTRRAGALLAPHAEYLQVVVGPHNTV